jgi:hypothetical protein
VNLIYAAFYQLQNKESFLDGVAQDLEKRIEIDYVDLRGLAFEAWDRRALLTQLVHAGVAEAVFFSSSGLPVPPTEVLYKKAVVLAPGYFDHVDPIHAEIHARMLASAIQQLRGELDETKSAPRGFFCLPAVARHAEDPAQRVPDLLHRIDALLSRGGDVLLFREQELYTMTEFVNRYTKEPVRFVVGLSLLIRAWEDRYRKLGGQLLEALSRLFAQNVRIYVYPMTLADLQQSILSLSATRWQWSGMNGWVSARQLRPGAPLGHLYDYALASDFLVPMPIPKL